MNINVDKSPHQCSRCGMTLMQIDGRMACPNCSTDSAVKTGRTMIVTEPNGEGGPVKVQYVDAPALVASASQSATPVAGVVSAPAAGTININVPIDLFPDLVMWARKLKLPKNWAEAAKIKAITDFQVELTNKLGGLK